MSRNTDTITSLVVFLSFQWCVSFKCFFISSTAIIKDLAHYLCIYGQASQSQSTAVSCTVGPWPGFRVWGGNTFLVERSLFLLFKKFFLGTTNFGSTDPNVPRRYGPAAQDNLIGIIISVRECIFLGMQKNLPKFDLAFPNNVAYKQQDSMLRLKRAIVN